MIGQLSPQTTTRRMAKAGFRDFVQSVHQDHETTLARVRGRPAANASARAFHRTTIAPARSLHHASAVDASRLAAPVHLMVELQQPTRRRKSDSIKMKPALVSLKRVQRDGHRGDLAPPRWIGLSGRIPVNETRHVARAPTRAPGRCISPAICAGATPCRSSRAWRPTGRSRWTKSTASAGASRRAPAKPIPTRPGARNGAAMADRVAAVADQAAAEGRTDHGRQPVHARRQLLLQRGTLHAAGTREARDVSQGAALLPGRDGAAAPGHRTRRGAVRGHQPAGLVREGRRLRPRGRPWCCSTAWTTPRR